MHKNKPTSIKTEIIIGIVAAIGTNRKSFLEELEKTFKEKDYHVETIEITDSLLEIKSPKNRKLKEIPKSLKAYLKMKVLNIIREKKYRGAVGAFMVDCIKARRKKLNNSEKKVVYIVDQLKNIVEYKTLSHVYGRNYIQISLFSNEEERDKVLKNKFNSDAESDEKFTIKIKEPQFKKIKKWIKIKDIFELYKKDISPDATHRLMEKDSIELYLEYKNKKKDYGQQVSKLFHRSHYFLNLDKNEEEISKESRKFIDLLVGENKEYPTDDEFGMNLAYQASFRSNFSNDDDIREIGASILSEHGEVISVASIRAPARPGAGNTALEDKRNIQKGYEKYKTDIKNWGQTIEDIVGSDEETKKCWEIKKKNCGSKKSIIDIKNHLKEMGKFLKDSLDFHPCTHAEMAAILDAAKMGISIRNAILYSTTFPCHLCAKDIINAGIKRVVYLEAYPKSKNKELYPDLIDFDSSEKRKKIPFDFFTGVAPKRFRNVYSRNNKPNSSEKIPPLLKYEHIDYYEKKEDDIISYLRSDEPPENKQFLEELLGKS